MQKLIKLLLNPRAESGESKESLMNYILIILPLNPPLPLIGCNAGEWVWRDEVQIYYTSNIIGFMGLEFGMRMILE